METEEFTDFVLDDTSYKTTLSKKFKNRKKYQAPDPKMIYATIPGTVREILVKEGDHVKQGAKLVTFDAMKMHNRIFALREGKIKKINLEKDKTFVKGQLLIEME